MQNGLNMKENESPNRGPTKRVLDLWVQCGFLSIFYAQSFFCPVE
jgi:hypothetical protein